MAAPLAPTRRALLTGLGASLLAPSSFARASSAANLSPAQNPNQTLYQQSLLQALGPSPPGVAFLLFHLRTGQALASTFAPNPLPVGSLLKPFLALAYARTFNTFPSVTCHGHADRCWSAAGHGTLALPQAIAQSCNAYFLTLALSLDPAAIPYLPSPPPNPTPETLIGLTPAWPIAPITLAHAYAALLAAPLTPALAGIHRGMRLCAAVGTAAHIGSHPGGVLAKTGTAPCVAACRTTGDGFVLAAVPALQPRLLLLVHKRATTGSATAACAGQMLTHLESLHVS